MIQEYYKGSVAACLDVLINEDEDCAQVVIPHKGNQVVARFYRIGVETELYLAERRGWIFVGALDKFEEWRENDARRKD